MRRRADDAGEETDERSDFFALGVMVVEALTGNRPFTGRPPAELLTAILHESYVLPGAGDEIARLNDTLRGCLAKDRRARYATAAALQQDLIPALRACPPLAAAPGVLPDEGPTAVLTGTATKRFG